MFTPLIWMNRPRPYIHPHFIAARYRFPTGCAVRGYAGGESIALACAEPEYRFDDWAKYGLRWPGKPGWRDGRQTGTYYRVGDDLIGIQCAFDDCIVNGVERNVFTSTLPEMSTRQLRQQQSARLQLFAPTQTR